jgi:hypothetical protein
MDPLRVLAALATALVLGVPKQTAAHPACKPALTFKQTRFSQPHNQQRKWTAILAVDASRCAENAGLFEIKFVRLKEFGPELLFTERFKWRPVTVEVSLDFWSDEAVLDYWIGDVSPCGCTD